VQAGYQRVLESDESQVLRTQQQQQQEIVQQCEAPTNEERYVQVYEGMTYMTTKTQTTTPPSTSTGQETMYGIPLDVWSRMPQNVKDIYTQQNQLRLIREQEQQNLISNMQTWRTTTLTGQLLDLTQNPNAALVEKTAPAFIPKEVFHVNDMPVQGGAAGFVASFESIVKPYIPTPTGVLAERLIPRYVYSEEQGKVIQDASIGWNEQQIKQLPAGYTAGFVLGEALQLYLTQKVTDWGLNRLDVYAQSGGFDFLSENAYNIRNVEIPDIVEYQYLTKSALNPSELAFQEQLEFKVEQEFHDWLAKNSITETVASSGFAADHQISTFTGFENKGWADSFKKFYGSGFVEQQLETPKFLNPFTEFFYSPKMYSPKLFGIDLTQMSILASFETSKFLKPSLFSASTIRTEPIISPKTIQYKDLVVSQSIKQISELSLLQSQKQAVSGIIAEKTNQQGIQFLKQRSKANTFNDQFLKQNSIQETQQGLKQLQKQMQIQIQTLQPLNRAKPKQQLKRQFPFFKPIGKRAKFGGGWFGRKWPSAVDPEKLLGLKQPRRRRRRK